MAAASTRVGVHSLHPLNASAEGSGNIIFLQYLIISCQPATVIAVIGGGRGQRVVKFDLVAGLVVGWGALQQPEPGSIALVK